jgi:MFS family permease
MIYNATRSLSWSGLAFLIEWLPRLVVIPLAGSLVDTFGSRRMFIVSDGGRMVMLIVAIVLVALQPHMWPILLGVAVVNGLLGQLSFVAAEHMGVQIPTKKSHHQVQSVQVGIDQTVMVMGPMLAGALLFFGNLGVLVGVGILSMASLFFAMRLRLVHATARAGQLSILSGFRRGWSIIAASRPLQFVVIGTVAFNFLLAFITVITPATIKGEFGGTDGHVSLLWTVGAIVSIFSVYVASRIMKRTGIVVIGTVSGIFASLAILVASMTHTYIVYAICVTLFLAMDGVYAVYIRTARARIVPIEHFGVTVGVIVLFSLIPFPLVGIVVAAIPQALLSTVLGVCTGICLLVTTVSYMKIDRLALAESASTR